MSKTLTLLTPSTFSSSPTQFYDFEIETRSRSLSTPSNSGTPRNTPVIPFTTEMDEGELKILLKRQNINISKDGYKHYLILNFKENKFYVGELDYFEFYALDKKMMRGFCKTYNLDYNKDNIDKTEKNIIVFAITNNLLFRC